jgi:hypothetical protein
MRHVAVVGACLLAGLAGLEHMVREPYPRAQVTLANERAILDEWELWSLHVCPRGIADFRIQRDPYGNPYRLICDPQGDRVTLAVVSTGSEDEGAEDALVSSRTLSP